MYTVAAWQELMISLTDTLLHIALIALLCLECLLDQYDKALCCNHTVYQIVLYQLCIINMDIIFDVMSPLTLTEFILENS